MKITLKLAYSQLKVNRSRTMWTIIAIVLSSALTTAVCSFAASGNAMLVDFLGENYGLYGKSYLVLLLIPAILLGMIIFAMSVTVISNVFRISTQERIMQFGILKCTGATKKQIIETVMYESTLLCLISIPAGIISGLLLSLCGITVANHYIEELNDLAHIMIREISLSLNLSISWQALVLSAVLCFMTVLFSAWLPSHKAAKIPAIDCIRGAGAFQTGSTKIPTSLLADRLFGFEGTLAAKNLKRSRRNFRATMISLSVGVILFIGLGGLSSQAGTIEEYMYPDAEHTVISDYVTNYTRKENPVTGKMETIFLKPIDSDCGNKIAKKLEEFENISIFGIGSDRDTYETTIPIELISEQMLTTLKQEEQPYEELPVEIIILDQEHYDSLCRKAGVPTGSTILLNHYSYNDFGKEINLIPFSSDIKEIVLKKADGSTTAMPVQGILTQEDMPSELFYPNTNPVRLLVPDAQVREYSWYCAPSDISGFIQYSNNILKEQFPGNEASSYMEEGFHVRVYKIDDYMKVMNIAIALVSVFMYSFAALLLLIGLTNVISTLSTNVRMRSREFAVLKSVGMTPEGLKQMLTYECILCTVKALFYGLPIGIAVTYLINLPVRSMLPIPYEIPWPAILLCILAVFFITFSITRYAAHKLENQNLIETIRSESGR